MSSNDYISIGTGRQIADYCAKKAVDKAIADRAEWRADERRWCREGKLPYPGWWKQKQEEAPLTLEATT